jgi:imidazoleglycerol-phosphate dehydratase
MKARALAEEFAPYVWSPSSEEVAARHGLRPEQVLRYDQNTPPLPGVPQVPLSRSFARLNEYPDGTYRELREAAAAYCGVKAEQIVPGAGADDLIAVCAATYLGPGRAAAISPPTYALYAIATRLQGAEVSHEPDDAALIWVCNPNNPTGELQPPAAIAAAALRDPRLEIEETIAERGRVRDALLAAGHACPETATNFVFVPTEDPVGEQLEEKGLVVRIFREGIRITLRSPHENDVLLAALGADPAPAPGRTAYVARTTTETALRISLELDGRGRARVRSGIGFLDHLLTLWAFHAGFDLELVAGGDLEVDEHHTVEDVLAALGDAVGQALGPREGIARYGAATVPMDEASATAAVDLVRRPHAEIDLRFAGDRVGALAPSLLPHALERFAMQAGLTLHVTAAGADDHHVAEAAFKVIGRALQQACALGADGIRSTKGAA